jgi:hypothetical protein
MALAPSAERASPGRSSGYREPDDACPLGVMWHARRLAMGCVPCASRVPASGPGFQWRAVLLGRISGDPGVSHGRGAAFLYGENITALANGGTSLGRSRWPSAVGRYPNRAGLRRRHAGQRPCCAQPAEHPCLPRRGGDPGPRRPAEAGRGPSVTHSGAARSPRRRPPKPSSSPVAGMPTQCSRND